MLELSGQSRDTAGFSGDFRRLVFSTILIELHNLEGLLNQHKSHIIYWNYLELLLRDINQHVDIVEQFVG